MQVRRASGLILDVAGQVGGAMPSTTTLYDRSRFQNNSSAWTGATWTQLPSKLWVLTFDGNDQITIPNTLAYCLNGYKEVTCLAWVKRTVINPASSSYILQILNGVGSTRLLLRSISTTGNISLAARSDNEVSSQSIDSAFIPNIYEWSLWGGTISLSGSSVTAYYNTTSQVSGGKVFTYPYFNNTVGISFIGFSGGGAYLTGMIAKLRIWVRALSMAAIGTIYDNEKQYFGIGK